MSSIPRHHAEWLSLLEISGPFLSLPVLLRVFPQGLEVVETEQRQVLKAAFEEWADNQQGVRPERAIHHAWVRFVLGELGFGEGMLLEGQAIPSGLVAEVPEHGVTLRPDLVVVSPHPRPLSPKERGEEKRERGEGGGVRMLIKVVPASQDLEKPVTGGRWQASVATQMMALLHGTGVRLGLVTNGGQWMLVHAPRGETTGFISWYAHLWFDEPLTLRAFVSLLGAMRFFGVPEAETLEAMLAESGKDQHEVTDQLGYQVRQAVEILIRDLDQADVDRGRKLLAEVGEARLYEAALTVMMRLVFLLSAEERSLLPLDDPFYAEYYAVSTLRAQLREGADQQGEEVLSLRTDAWSRLLATFRAVFGGVQHERLRLIAYGGSLFDPDRFPFLEGRAGGTSWRDTASDPLPVDNRTVLHLLEALQILRVKVPGGGGFESRRLSFRALDIEQIGHVYEGLLDHMAVRAQEPVVGLAGTREKEPEIPLAKLENLTQGRKDSKTQGFEGHEKLLDFLQEATGRSRSALTGALTAEAEPIRVQRLRTVCQNDEALFARVKPFAGLIREDDNGFPVVLPAGSVYVTSGATRRATGTHYTPRSLTEPIVQHTLEPLVYVGPAEGLPKEEWVLRRPESLLALKICDMAMGSGAFLVQVVRYLAERLVEAWDLWGEGTEDGGQKTESPSSVSGLLSPEDRLQLAKRLIADRCLYGVDKNPLAVEMAKLSLWLITLDKNRPFTFLDHSLKCGDALVGASEDDYLRWAHRRMSGTMMLDDQALRENIALAREKRKALQAFQVLDVRDADRKAALLKEADEAIQHVKRGCDLLVGAKLLGLNSKDAENMQIGFIDPYMAGNFIGDFDSQKYPDAARALNAARKERTFHWAFEFPEVFEGGGFSAFVGNPPFIGGYRVRSMLGDLYFDYFHQVYDDYRGQADVCALFFVNAFSFLKIGGCLGLLATNTISQGDTREASLDVIYKGSGKIFKANKSVPWPGTASVSVSTLHVIKGSYQGQYLLDEKVVSHITPMLVESLIYGTPKQLTGNQNIGFKGSDLLGIGFWLDPGEAFTLLETNPRNKDVLYPCLDGSDLNSNPNQQPNRWAINFFDWSLEKAETYPEVLEIVKERVYPQRQKNNRKVYRDKWWQYGEKRLGLHEAIKNLNKVLVSCIVTKHLNFVFVPKGWVYSKQLAVFAVEEFMPFALLQSSIHEIWARRYSSTLETRLSYTLGDAFETFPFFTYPLSITQNLENIGNAYHEYRRQIMLTRQEGLTATYNRFHDPEEAAPDIVRLRELHVEMDVAVASAYGWEDLALGHGFHETAQGVRFTISESARREVLGRLLALNHRRWEEEQEGREVDKVNRVDRVNKVDKRKRGGGEEEKRSGREKERRGKGEMKAKASVPENQVNFFGVVDVPEPEKLTKLPYYGISGKVFRCSMPFHKDYDPDGKAYTEMKAQKVSAVVMLVSDDEARKKSGRDLRAMYQKDGITVIHLPIEDFGVPARSVLDEAVAQALKLAREGKSIAVHCSAGIGRTGLFLAELAKKAMGLDGEKALYWVRLYVPGAVETEGQRGMVVGLDGK